MRTEIVTAALRSCYTVQYDVKFACQGVTREVSRCQVKPVSRCSLSDKIGSSAFHVTVSHRNARKGHETDQVTRCNFR